MFFVFVLFNLHIPHVNLTVHEQNWSPFALDTPILLVHNFLDINIYDLSFFILDPPSTVQIGQSHKLAFAVVFMCRIWMMIVVPFVQDHSDQSVFPCGLCVLDWFEEEVVEYPHFIQNVVEEHISHLNISHLFDVYVCWKSYLEFIYGKQGIFSPCRRGRTFDAFHTCRDPVFP